MKGLLKRNKKTFIFMTSLLLFLIGAGVIQEIVKNLKPFEDVPVVSVETKDENKNQGSEILKKPVNDDVKVSKGFYDTSLDDKKLEEALVYFEGVYRPNDGIDYTKDNESFDVYASASGTVIRKENDSLLGWIVTIEHQKGIQTIYQSLDDIKVEKGDQVKQGDVIGKAGNTIKLIVENASHYRMNALIFNRTVEFMAFLKEKFGQGEIDKALNGMKNSMEIMATFYPNINEYKGNVQIQIVIDRFC